MSPLRIALLHPTYWPEVRRGSERLIHDLGATLASRGHDVTLLTSHDGGTTTSMEDGIRVVRARRPPEARLQRKYENHLGNVPGTIWRLAHGEFDLAHAFFQAEAWAAVKARRFGGPPVIFACHGILVRPYLVERRYRIEMLKQVVAGAAATTVLSNAAAEPVRQYLLTEPQILPGGVICDQFAADVPRAAEPAILCAASIGAPHKRAETLFAAFELLRGRRPDVRLQVVRTPDPFMSPVAAELPQGAELIDADETDALAAALGSAWVSVLPSVDEAFGLVLLESLAAGTPVVAARSGGPPDIVDDDRIGRLFEPDDVGDLARALDEALELADDADNARACRDRAAEHDWTRVVERYEDLYRAVLAGEASGAP